MKAIAYSHGPSRVIRLAEEFARGADACGVACEVRRVEEFSEPAQVPVVWMYGLGDTMEVFKAYAGIARRVTGDVGYWRDVMPRALDLSGRYVRIAVDAQQPDAHLRLRPHPADRFEKLGLHHRPVRERGSHVLVCGYSAAQAQKFGSEYGAWETGICAALREVTDRPIFVREKPKNPPLEIAGTTRCAEDRCSRAIRDAWAVVIRSGNVGADCLLHGVPVYAEMGPGRVYGLRALSEIHDAPPPHPDERMAALSDLAYWQWTYDEIGAGELWRHLEREGMA